MDYAKFLESKRHTSQNYGIEVNFMPEGMFDYQKHVAEYSIKKGRCADFLDTGLGKTLIELTVAKNYIHHTNKPVLIITPLAVAFQFIKEAKKFNIDDIEYSKDGKYKSKIVVCNYEALGYLGHTDMLGKFFKNNNNNAVKIGQIDKARIGMEWYLKPHAEKDFWRWIASWSISCRKPSDLGFSDERHKLPELIENEIVIQNTRPLVIDGQVQIFNRPAVNWREIKVSRKHSYPASRSIRLQGLSLTQYTVFL